MRASAPGPLEGMTVIRFAHAFDSGGGTERYLDDVDGSLLERSTATIVRLHLTAAPSPPPIEQRRVGRGLLIHVRLPVLGSGGAHDHVDETRLGPRLRRSFRDRVLCGFPLWQLYTARWLERRRIPRRFGEAIGAGTALDTVLGERRADLLMLHFCGGADASEVIATARRHGVPVALLNHYANERLLNLSIRQHALAADAVAGVNGIDVPRYLTGRFTNLADGIDTDFFQSTRAAPLAAPPAGPILLLPARVVREKGHLDAIAAAAALRRGGLPCSLVFAGRRDSGAFDAELADRIAAHGLQDAVHFTGPVSLPLLRDWYAAAAAVVFPTYHHEGLPRVVLEAQAMRTPVVAYASGGIGEGIVDGETGFLVPTGRLEELTLRLRQLLLEPDRRSRVVEHARERAEQRFSLAALADRHERFYLRIAGR